MKSSLKTYHTIRLFSAMVWLGNGLFCKVLHLVPRHQQIVAEILGAGHARLFTMLIGLAEIIMTCWIISRFKPRLNALTQIMIVGTMNILEVILVPHMLLWGYMNALFALMFMALIYYQEFILKKQFDVSVP